MLLVGAPLRHAGALYNCALAIHRGRLLGVVPKVHLPNYREFYEPRHFVAGDGMVGGEIAVGALTAPFGTDLLFAAEDVPGLVVHAEICEDIWIPIPPSSQAALAGATVLANLSASNITIGKAETRRLLCASQSARCVAAYLYAAAGAGESTTDLAWDGQASIFENGATLAETERFPSASQFALADIDLDLLRQERMQMGSFDTNRRRNPDTFRRIAFRLDPPRGDIGLERKVERYPFVPADPARLEQDCYEAYNIQVSGLAQRLRATGIKRVVIGVSGGLDSTQALIVCAAALDLLGLPRGNILAYTMPGFATSAHTKANAIRADAVARRHLAGAGYPPRGEAHAGRHRPSFRAGQAGLRPDIRERAGRAAHRLPVPPGEPPQRHRHRHRRSVGAGARLVHLWRRRPDGALQRQCRRAEDADPASDPLGDQFAPVRAGCAGTTLDAILATEITPNWCRQRKAKRRRAPRQISARMRCRISICTTRCATASCRRRSPSWRCTPGAMWRRATGRRVSRPIGVAAYDLATIRQWLEVFLRRFFAFSQFKRSAMPNGPKVSAGGSLSPRGDWRAPSDGNANAWLAELERNVPKG